MKLLLSTLLLSFSLLSCQVKPYAPPPQKAAVENVEISVKEFAGRPEVYARVQGRLTTSAAQLVESPQRREDGLIYLDVMEQTPRGADLMADLSQSPGFERIIPVDILGLTPGTYVLSVNGIQVPLEVPVIQGEPVSAGETPASGHVKDEMIAIEDAILVDPVPSPPAP